MGAGSPLISCATKLAPWALRTRLRFRILLKVIFVPGMSTAERVTETSGRGIGMDAVQRYLKSAGGSITIELLGPAEPGYQRFQFVTTLAVKQQNPESIAHSQAA